MSTTQTETTTWAGTTTQSTIASASKHGLLTNLSCYIVKVVSR